MKDEEETLHRIEQAFAIAPVMTIGMLQSFLTSRVNKELRNGILEALHREGRIGVEVRVFRALNGHTSQMQVLTWKGGQL